MVDGIEENANEDSDVIQEDIDTFERRDDTDAFLAEVSTRDTKLNIWLDMEAGGVIIRPDAGLGSPIYRIPAPRLLPQFMAKCLRELSPNEVTLEETLQGTMCYIDAKEKFADLDTIQQEVQKIRRSETIKDTEKPRLIETLQPSKTFDVVWAPYIEVQLDNALNALTSTKLLEDFDAENSIQTFVNNNLVSTLGTVDYALNLRTALQKHLDEYLEHIGMHDEATNAILRGGLLSTLDREDQERLWAIEARNAYWQEKWGSKQNRLLNAVEASKNLSFSNQENASIFRKEIDFATRIDLAVAIIKKKIQPMIDKMVEDERFTDDEARVFVTDVTKWITQHMNQARKEVSYQEKLLAFPKWLGIGAWLGSIPTALVELACRRRPDIGMFAFSVGVVATAVTQAISITNAQYKPLLAYIDTKLKEFDRTYEAAVAETRERLRTSKQHEDQLDELVARMRDPSLKPATVISSRSSVESAESFNGCPIGNYVAAYTQTSRFTYHTDKDYSQKKTSLTKDRINELKFLGCARTPDGKYETLFCKERTNKGKPEAEVFHMEIAKSAYDGLRNLEPGKELNEYPNLDTVIETLRLGIVKEAECLPISPEKDLPVLPDASLGKYVKCFGEVQQYTYQTEKDLSKLGSLLQDGKIQKPTFFDLQGNTATFFVKSGSNQGKVFSFTIPSTDSPLSRLNPMNRLGENNPLAQLQQLKRGQTINRISNIGKGGSIKFEFGPEEQSAETPSKQKKFKHS